MTTPGRSLCSSFLLGVTVALAAAVLAGGCGGPERHLDRGWALYGQGRYSDALERFDKAADVGADREDGLLMGRAANGIAWSNLRLSELDGAEVAFDDAIALLDADPERADALAGRAGLRLALERPGGARTDARLARTLEPAWSSFHDELDAADLATLALLASLRLGELAEAQAELDRLDPANGLDLSDPQSWVVAGTMRSSYLEALLAAAAETLSKP